MLSTQTKCLVLGATGIIGNHVLRELINRGLEVVAAARGRTPPVNLKDLDVKFIFADTDHPESLGKAFAGINVVFHCAGYYPRHMFQKDRQVVQALAQIRHVLAAAQKNGVRRVVYTSSYTTIGQAKPNQLADESLPYDLLGRDPHPYFLLKHLVEEEIRQWVTEKKLSVVMVNPTGCFGPYELKPKSLSVFAQVAGGAVPALIDHANNVVDVADVARGHVLAAEYGRDGERYVLGGHNATIVTMVREICAVAGVKPPRFIVPLAPALPLSFLDEAACFLTGHMPHFPMLGLRFLQYGQHFSCDKAIRELGYKVSPMPPCYQRALEWFQKIGYCHHTS